MTEIKLLLFLLCGHLICDFYLQSKEWVTKRNIAHHKAPELLYHAISHGLITFIILFFLGKKGFWLSVSFGFIILITHYIIDLIKSYCPETEGYFILDQIAHLIILLVGWLILVGGVSEFKAFLSPETWNIKYVVIFLAYLVILKPASIITSISLKPWSKNFEEKNKSDSKNVEPPNFAGQRIGYLERVLILTFILLNQFAAIGFLLAAKSVFRFGDLTQDKDKKLTEYVMLGTLTSFTITIFVGLAVIAIVPEFSLVK